MPTLAEFVADELLRAPMVFDHAIDAVLRQWRGSLHAPPPRNGVDPPRALASARSELVQAATASLRRSALQAVETPSAPAGSPAAGGPESWQLLMQAPSLELSLLDDDVMADDIALSRTIEAVRSGVENELREYQAYVSALAGDIYVSRDFNPLRPEAWVQALRQAAQSAPLPRWLQAPLMRDSATVLADALRHGYAASARRLADAGVERATHRTIVHAGGSRTAVDPNDNASDLHDLRESMPIPLDGPPVPSVEAIVTPMRNEVVEPTPSPAAAGTVDAQLIELLTRLFDAMQSDRHLSPETQALLLRLHPTVLRAALHDPQLLDSYEHAAWRFVDAVAFALDGCPRADLSRTQQFVRGLADDLATNALPGAARFEWAQERLLAFQRHLLERTLAAIEPTIQEMSQRDRREAGDTTSSSPTLDIGNLDTVPAGLLDEEAEPPAVIGDYPVGGWLRTYLQGDWRHLQLLWKGEVREIWLLLDAKAMRLIALRRLALDRLAADGLAGPLRPRSLVRAAAARVLRAMSSPAAQ